MSDPLVPARFLLRRQLLTSSAMALLATAGCAQARTFTAARPWNVGAGDPPPPLKPGPWAFFTPEEGAMVDALTDRLIPADELGAGARLANVAVFIDRQLAGFYGSAERLYMRPPFSQGTPMQGNQSPRTPAAQYRTGLAALAVHVKAAFAGQKISELSPDQRDRLLAGMETGAVKLEGADARGFFELLLQNTMEGFFSDPVYGGNKDMVGWKMIGFPGARYDYRDHIAQHNMPYPLPPVGIAGRPEWTPKG
jgi:gluconate 2-dehydrogenase gamma chain